MSRFSILCAICLDELRPGDDESLPVAASCGHIFCRPHIEKHMSSVKRPRKADCPVCRTPIAHTTRLYPHIEEPTGDGKRRVSGPKVPVERVVERIERATNRARRLAAGDGLEDDMMDVITAAEKTVLELDAHKEAKILRVLKPFAVEVEKLRREYSHTRRDRASELAAAQRKYAELEAGYDSVIAQAAELADLATKEKRRADELAATLDEVKRKYRTLKREHTAGDAETQKWENERKTLKLKLAVLEKENRRYRKQRTQTVDDSLEIVG